MSNVTLTIGGRHYTVACATGEEEHIGELGRVIDAKLQDIPNLSGQAEARTLLFAALLLADELHEARGGAASPAAAPPAASSPVVAESLEALAGRLEGLASRLDGGA